MRADMGNAADFWQMQTFDGPGPETINSRLAMVKPKPTARDTLCCAACCAAQHALLQFARQMPRVWCTVGAQLHSASHRLSQKADLLCAVHQAGVLGGFVGVVTQLNLDSNPIDMHLTNSQLRRTSPSTPAVQLGVLIGLVGEAITGMSLATLVLPPSPHTMCCAAWCADWPGG
jgi:hypothetical protein